MKSNSFFSAKKEEELYHYNQDIHTFTWHQCKTIMQWDEPISERAFDSNYYAAEFSRNIQDKFHNTM